MKFPLMFASLALLLVSSASAQDWGNLKVKFVLDGKAPTPAKANVNKDIDFCGKHKLVDETLIVSDKGGIQNVVLYLTPKAGSPKPKIHPDYAKAGDVVLDNHNCHFEPHVVVLSTSQNLVVKNSDTVGHNTKADFFNNTPFNDLIPAGGSIKKKFTKLEGTPTPASCSIHPWMSARILIREDPYAATSDKDGNLKIDNLPVGKWTFTIWHEGCGFVQSGKLGGKETKWAKGKIDVEVKKGDNDLGEITIPVAVLTKMK